MSGKVPPLVDVEERARAYPREFHIPERAERASLRVGQLVKLIFGDRERMWVRIDRVEDGRYRGALENVSVEYMLDYGDPVEFGPEHVLDIETESLED